MEGIAPSILVKVVREVWKFEYRNPKSETNPKRKEAKGKKNQRRKVEVRLSFS